LFAAEKTTPRPKKPNSKFAGVQIGLNVPYSFGIPRTAGEILEHCIELNLSAVELRAQPVEAFLGLPAKILPPGKGAVASTPAAEANVEKVRAWRRAVSMDRVKAFRRTFEDAGVAIEILKVDRFFALTDDMIDYHFTMAKALGARAISTEISKTQSDMERMGHFADKHRLLVGYHGHASTTPAHWEQAFAYSKFNGANVDLGHFVAGNNISPADFIKKHHARIPHIHLKDRKKNNGANLAFGEGDTPIVEVLRLIRDQRWKIQGTIELEYKVPAGSTRLQEIARSIKYCRDALV